MCKQSVTMSNIVGPVRCDATLRGAAHIDTSRPAHARRVDTVHGRSVVTGRSRDDGGDGGGVGRARRGSRGA